MKKITDFIVEKRGYVFSFFVLLCLFCVFLSSKVNINRDIMKYLPETSETHIGKDLMDKEFPSDSSTLNVMFHDLTDTEKIEIQNHLEEIEHVTVEYDTTEDYNKDEYTLFTLTIDEPKESSVSKNVFEEVSQTYKEYDIAMSGDVYEEYKVVLPTWIVALAIFCALLILILLCDSYLEPILFLIAILMAVLLNKGTNIFFPSISSITNSIAAILQLALSMDYSIMLMNRYKEEKEKTSDKVIAMKNALKDSFLTISSSSITTIVGLLALVFMSFTIGKDLGLVLAKGVLFSLLAIFTCLPFLLLTFDTWITKTKKKSPVFHLEKLGAFAYRHRVMGVCLFLLIFVGSFLLKGNLQVLYTDSDTNAVEQVFPVNNQIALLYSNDLESDMSAYCNSLEENERIQDVLCYGSMLNHPYTVPVMQDKLKELDDKIVEEYLLKIVYYHYYNKDEQNKIPVEDFIQFIKENVYTNDSMNSHVTPAMKENIDRLEDLITQNTKLRSVSEIANMFELDSETVRDLFTLYHSKQTLPKVTLQEFLPYAKDYSKELEPLTKYLDKNLLTEKKTEQELSTILGIDESSMHSLYLYYLTQTERKEKILLPKFMSFLTDVVLKDNTYSASLSEEEKQNIILLKEYTNKEKIKKPIQEDEMALFLHQNKEEIHKAYLGYFLSHDHGESYSWKEIYMGIQGLEQAGVLDDTSFQEWQGLFETHPELLQDETKYQAREIQSFLQRDGNDVLTLYTMMEEASGESKNWTVSPYELVSYLNEVSPNETIQKVYFMMSSTLSKTSYSYQEIANIFQMDEGMTKNIYALYLLNEGNVKTTLKEFLNFLSINLDGETLKNEMNETQKLSIRLLNEVVNGVLENKSYAVIELSNLFNVSTSQIQLLISKYDIDVKNANVQVSYKDFVTFLLNDVDSNEITNEKRQKLNVVKHLINDAKTKTAYTKDELYEKVSVLSKDVTKDFIDLLYIYYGSDKTYDETYTLTLEEFVRYLNEEILKDSRFEDFISEERKQDILDSKDTIQDARELLVGDKYSRVVLNTHYPLETEETFDWMKQIKTDWKDKEVYVIGDSSMAYEMNESFPSELNFITILTILFIFVVVFFTFKKFFLPILLVLLIQTAVYMTMGILSISGSVYFISLLIVQSILMGATIDYAILYSSYYLEARQKLSIKDSLIDAYQKSIHTILTSSSILTLVTLVVGYFGSAVTSKICITISEGTICSAILTVLLLPELLAFFDKWMQKKR